MDETLALIKEKCGLKRQYSQAHDPFVKTPIHQLQKVINDNFRIESQTSWKKFYNDISLETNHTESWPEIKNFLKAKGQHDYLALHLNAKTAKADTDKVQHFADSVKSLIRGKALGLDNIHSEILRLGTTTSLFHYLARLFTSSIQIGYVPAAWKLAILRVLPKPDKLPSFTSSYQFYIFNFTSSLSAL